MCNDNFNGGYPYNRFPISYLPPGRPFNNNRGCCCGCGNGDRYDDFIPLPEVVGPPPRPYPIRRPIHFEDHRDRNNANNNSRGSVRFREFEQNFDNNSCFSRNNDDREFDRGYPGPITILPFAQPFDEITFDNWYNNGWF